MIHVCARTHEHCAYSLRTGKSNNNSGDFTEIFESGGGGNFLKFSAEEGPISSHVHARRGPVASV